MKQTCFGILFFCCSFLCADVWCMKNNKRKVLIEEETKCVRRGHNDRFIFHQSAKAIVLSMRKKEIFLKNHVDLYKHLNEKLCSKDVSMNDQGRHIVIQTKTHGNFKITCSWLIFNYKKLDRYIQNFSDVDFGFQK